MASKFNEAKFDQRVINYNIRKGTIDKKDYEAFLKTLPNEEGNYETITITDEPKVIQPTFQSIDSTESDSNIPPLFNK